MRIVHLTPGTGNFHCGSCLRDNVLVKELRRRGHDVTMVPLYLPLVTDDDSAAGDVPVFLGGINLYLQEQFAAFRHMPRWLERLLDRRRLLLLAADRAGMTSAAQLGKMTIGSFRAAEGRQAREWRKLIDWIAAQDPKPDLVSLSNGLLVGIAKSIRRDLGIPVIASLQGEDSFLDTLPEPFRSDAWEAFRAECRDVAALIAVSEFYADVMRGRLKLPRDRIKVVLNAIDHSAFAPPPQPPANPVIGYMARLHHSKGLHTLVDAFIELSRRASIPNLRLRLAGSKTSSDDAFIGEQMTKLRKAGLADAVELHENISFAEKVALLQSLSVLSVPAAYGEAFGLYVLEALACGVPFVEPRRGAFPELLEHTGGGILCEPDDPDSLADGLESLLQDESRRRDLGAAGRAAVLEKFGVDRMARDFERVCEDALRGDAADRPVEAG